MRSRFSRYAKHHDTVSRRHALSPDTSNVSRFCCAASPDTSAWRFRQVNPRCEWIAVYMVLDIMYS